MRVNCCDICEAFEYCMEQPDGVGIDDFEPPQFERAACRFGHPYEYRKHLATLGGDVE